MDPTYGNALRRMVTDPGSFSGTPGFQFALNQGLDATARSNSRMRGSGNALAALTKYGTGLAQQDYGAQMDRLTRASGQEQQYGLGQEQNQNAATQNANALTLGTEQNRLTGLRNANDFTLGQGQLTNTANANDQNFGLGMYQANNAWNLGNRQADNTAQGNWQQYDLGQQQNANTAANNQNTFNTNQGRNAIDWFGAQTQRGQAQGNQWLGEQRNERDWMPFNPQRRIA